MHLRIRRLAEILVKKLEALGRVFRTVPELHLDIDAGRRAFVEESPPVQVSRICRTNLSNFSSRYGLFRKTPASEPMAFLIFPSAE